MLPACVLSWPFYGLTSIIALYWYFTRNFNYFKKRGIIGPRPVPVLGNLWDVIFVSNPELEVQRFKKYGKIYGVFEGQKPILRIGEPAIVKEIIVKEFNTFQTRRDTSNAKHPIVDLIVTLRGDEWRRMRSTGSPTTSVQLRTMYPLVSQSANEFVNALAKRVTPDGDNTLDMKAWFECYAMDVLAVCIFGAKTGAYTDPNDPFVVNARKIFRPPGWKIVATLVVPTFLLDMFNIKTETDDTATNFFYKITLKLLREKEERSRADNPGQKMLSENELISQLFASMNGGFEAASSIMAFCAHELALHQDLQERLYREVLALPPLDAAGEPDYEPILKLPYLDAVVAETMRLHSPALRPSRIATKDFRLTDTDITVEKGLMVEISAYGMHRSDEFFPRAEQFIPDRFLPENRSQVVPYSYTPYGGGPRGCIGQRFSQMVMKMAIAYLVRRFQFRLCGKTQVPVPLRKYIRFTSADAAYLALDPRP
ncbi:unnamed protein product [Medioppia subpectinata]|uniref:Cytochrome P450 n=1 Tax=Medioppia subpectinata TaxID=1979941 RepID=A0A7R9KWL1_9ACAR|nr:unnamed protein product [Medioppia subpectinata]CAG2110102.1 unnamed protein product [Medioppia subpectinata]